MTAARREDAATAQQASGGLRTRGEKRLEEIRRVVLDLVAERGIEGVTIDAIALAAGASKQTLYNQWPTKTELVRDAIKLSFSGASPGDPGDLGSLREEFRTIIESAADMLRTNGRLIIALLDGAQRDEVVFSLMRQETRENFRELLQRPLKRAIARQEIAPTTNLNLVADIALPLLLERAIWHEPIDDRYLDSLLDDVLMRLVDEVPSPKSAD